MEQGVRQLLDQAHQKVAEGDPITALQVVLAALRTVGGEDAVTPAIQQAKQALVQSRAAPQDAAQQLSDLFARCSLETEQHLNHRRQAHGDVQGGARAHTPRHAHPPLETVFEQRPGPHQSFYGPSPPLDQWSTASMDCAGGLSPISPLSARPPSILLESGRAGVTHGAATDGSSFVCVRCGGLVSSARREAHMAYWCQPGLSNGSM